MPAELRSVADMTEISASGATGRSYLPNLLRIFRKERRVPELVAAFNQTRSKHLATHLEVADDAYTRCKGLLGRDELESGRGIWIYPCESVHTFAMRFPIDLVYLDRHCVVKKVRSGVRPGRLSACLSARSVIELPAGTVASTGTLAGDHISIRVENGPEDLLRTPVHQITRV